MGFQSSKEILSITTESFDAALLTKCEGIESRDLLFVLQPSD
jgi:hypothetical protein